MMKNRICFLLFLMVVGVQMTSAAIPLDSVAYRKALLDSVAKWNPKQAADYYQHHLADQNLLRVPLVSRFMAHLEGLDYWQLRALRRTFWFTDLQDSVNPIYLQRRAELLPKIKADAEAHCKAELDSVERCRVLCKTLLSGSIGNSIEGALKGLTSGFLPDGKEDIEKLYASHCAANIFVGVLKDTLNRHITLLVRKLNASRKNYVNGLAGYYAAAGNYQVGGFSYVVKRHAVACPIDDLMAFQQMQGQIDWFRVGLDPASLLHNGVGQQLLSGQPLISPQQAGKNGDARKLSPVVNSIASATAQNIQSSVFQTVDDVFDFLVLKVKDSQTAFQNLVFAKY
ncbi:MAG: hypothetical protein LKF33_03235 [Prevotella sp.]|jgi:hypothetical protein|nr:hypothetical protein [Prevotella sp.]